MGKSIRSKRKKRLRTLKRELVEPHYDAKDVAKLAIQAAAFAAPKIELPKKREEMEDDTTPFRGRSTVPAGAATAAAEALTSMAVDSELPSSSAPTNLKATGGIRKRGKSSKGHVSKKVLKSKKKRGVKF
ncbi:hypothetical protein MPTK1_7g17170 [Marchantia polymorpha subsp. ruderalis]|uniref:Uncharacterized protein n=2 Tax=Marchantia polymorpha TaxID=3197 RepID=A0A176WQQ4_MARPO|nr:hypothetical protein AXG93_167s1370 [Marchantia polymorpha subsp. ruderalis]PTQ38451.1 hypothetical protein MARPO_0051s0054 [Marchantia polymorpha]BBN17826.1 hypothetical protein Mp_7g17170 [Marchantia polymorpha subsp. ruderalis]|eukprot:PTQ38451.1 hypothetical protein MARPO_0051s0054 [Marchantia polymorpha]